MVSCARMRVFAISDCHTDYQTNMDWVADLSTSQGYKGDALIVAGDVSDDLDVLTRTLELLAATFAHVFFVPGNHVRRESGRWREDVLPRGGRWRWRLRSGCRRRTARQHAAIWLPLGGAGPLGAAEGAREIRLAG